MFKKFFIITLLTISLQASQYSLAEETKSRTSLEKTMIQAAKFAIGMLCFNLLEGQIKLMSAHAAKIYVQTITGKRIDISTDLTDPIDGLKNIIKNKEGIPTEQQVLSFAGKHMDDGKTLLDYNVPADATLNLTLKLRKSK